VKKEILASLTLSHPWRQNVLIVKKVASRCPAESRSRQDVAYTIEF